MHFSNGRFSKKETGFSGPYVVGGLLGAAGEKNKRKPNVPTRFPLHHYRFLFFIMIHFGRGMQELQNCRSLPGAAVGAPVVASVGASVPEAYDKKCFQCRLMLQLTPDEESHYLLFIIL